MYIYIIYIYIYIYIYILYMYIGKYKNTFFPTKNLVSLQIFFTNLQF